jgi:hypothetical protein
MLATTIRTLGAHLLREYESGLTHPLVVNGWRAGEEIEFTYRLRKKPGFAWNALMLGARETAEGFHSV